MDDEEDDAPPGVPEWVVTYGDMMSLLLTFFIMLVSLSEVVAEQKFRAVLSSIQQQFGYAGGPLAPEGVNFPLDRPGRRRDTLGAPASEEAGRGGVNVRAVPGTETRVRQRRPGTPEPVGRPVPFAAGSDEWAGDADTRLAEIAAALAGKPHRVEVRGHAASAPGDGGVDARTLSYRRARRVLAALEAGGVDRSRVRLASVGDAEPPRPRPDGSVPPADRVEVRVLDAFAGE